HVAIVGPTGCGKTTLINLLMRFYDVDDGKIVTDGTDIKFATRKSLRRSYGMVLQESWIRKATVRENLTLGNDFTDDEITNAAKLCKADGFIRALDGGYDAVINEDSLSQGQKQLLCITRVMLLGSGRLILDEATSAVDVRTEKNINEAFDLLMKGKTSFVVAHRLSTIKHSDVILVMKEGNVIEKGTHEELIKQGGFYKELYDSSLAVR
ncbi:MAG: ATP-binding cassette domain-containing protein, partial [Clostridia bacterium]|nr:ATP-binding cassette domain-containing protein [Clostridia bacterium]